MPTPTELQNMTLAEIIDETGIDRSALNRYLAEPDTRAVLGGTATHPLYPVSSRPLFHRLAALHAAREVKPKTLAARLRNELANPVRNSDNPNSTNIEQAASALTIDIASEYPKSEQSEQALMIVPDALHSAAKSLADALIRAGVVVPSDRLVLTPEAAELLACPPRAVSRRVRPVERGRYRYSDIQAYIRALQPLPQRRRLCSKSEQFGQSE